MTNRRLLIHCAPSGVGTGSNFGMQTVDFAAHNLLQRLGLGDRGKLLHPWKPLDVAAGGDPDLLELDKWPCEFEISDESTAQSGDLVLSWGDFQLGYDYQIQSAKRYQQIKGYAGETVSSKDAIDWCYKTFLMENRLENTGIDVGSFGTTLFQNGMADWCDERYRPAIDRYLSQAKILGFRDPYSAWSSARFRDASSGAFWGSDAAFLNSPEELSTVEASGYSDQISSNTIGLYIGRSTRNTSVWGLSRLVKKMSKRLGCGQIWIPWNRFSGGRLFKRIPRSLNWFLPSLTRIPAEEKIMAGDILQTMAKCRLIVTDTYHVAVNAICLGIPVLCIYEASPASERDANMGYRKSWRDKRALLFTSTNQSDLLMCSDDLKSVKHTNAKIEHVASLVDNTQVLQNWRDWISKERDRNRETLESRLRELLGLS